MGKVKSAPDGAASFSAATGLTTHGREAANEGSTPAGAGLAGAGARPDPDAPAVSA